MDYLLKVEKDLGRKLTDSEVFGFAQINSEHCRHKIFGGTFIIDGEEMESSLFQMIKKRLPKIPIKLFLPIKIMWLLQKARLWNNSLRPTTPLPTISLSKISKQSSR